ncbi:uncharacterized protein TNCV_205401 [Trichonephila clavipes]|nr:uncharacterized protein TNCV_205401 [Trichonephila clavipes]
MDVCKCIVPLQHGSTLNSRRAASPLVWLVEKVKGWEVPDHPQVSSLKIGVETNQIVLSPAWCSKLWLTTGATYPFAMMNFLGRDLVFADQYIITVLSSGGPAKIIGSPLIDHDRLNAWIIRIYDFQKWGLIPDLETKRLSGVKSQDLGGRFTGPKREIGGHQTCNSINRLWHELCDILCRVLLKPQLLDIMIVLFRNEKVSNHGSITITIDCNVVVFIAIEEVRTNDSTSP